ncbi:hypothetical protein P879_01246 [Paragonimus westermani]|uniref:Endonuclease/exonuclease/phosphatase domain-containing protein n=1 Tax=Paragonimus westermani TaxID=34504 RepID=A0A8T0DSB0_9TREM|nr:hypothetical protein P879_01246 [Paragonimus westermani]
MQRNRNTTLHRPSRRINRVALSAVCDRVDRRKYATVKSSPVLSPDDPASTNPKGDNAHRGLSNMMINLKHTGGSESHDISPSIMSMRLGRGKCTTLVSVYGPAMRHTDNTKDQFYDGLSATIRSAPMSDRLFVLGDLNTRVKRKSVAWLRVLRHSSSELER